ncbi:hypothetical protein SH467x_000589 [Pirellulaceae bacterium SH467]
MSRLKSVPSSQLDPAKTKRIAELEAKIASYEARGLYSSKSVKPSKVLEEDEEDGELSEETEDPEEELEDAKSAWESAIQREMKVCGGDRLKATSRANRNNPGLRARLVRSANRLRAANSRRRYR